MFVYSPLLIPISIIMGVFVLMIVRTVVRARVRELEIRERIAMIERGLVPAPEVDPRGFDRAMTRLERREYRSGSGRHRRAGVTLMGVGFGLIFAPAMSSATLGVAPSDAGVASAMVNTMQQIGGSIGTALLSTLAAGATTAFVAGRNPTPDLLAQAAVHGYTTAFYWSAAIFLVAAVVCTALLRPGVAAPQAAGEPVFAH